MNVHGPTHIIPNFYVREMIDKDIDSVIKIEQEVYPYPWTENILKELFYFGLNNQMNHSTVIDDDNKNSAIYGYSFWQMIVDECHILNFAISAENHGKGYGSFFLKKILKEAKNIGAQRATLEVRIGNEPAIGLYKKIGFTVIAMRKNYYVDDGKKEDALIMWLQNI